MRSPDEAKRELQRLRFTEQIPLAQISKDSRCSMPALYQIGSGEASETILRRFDAYLDATHLHVSEKMTARMAEMKRMKFELWREYGARSIPVKDMLALSPDKQKRLRLAMHWRLKRLLREKVEKEHGFTPYFLDSESYWRCKAKIRAKLGELASKGNDPRRQGSRPEPPR